MSVNVSVWLRFTNSAALRMPRRPTSQETTTATRAQSAAAAKRQRWQQQQQREEKKNCHANDSRLQWAIVYCCCCCSCCQLTTTCSRCCLLPARLHTHRLSAHTLPAKLARSRFHTPRAPQCYVGAPTRVGIFVEMFGHDVRSGLARADCDV